MPRPPIKVTERDPEWIQDALDAIMAKFNLTEEEDDLQDIVEKDMFKLLHRLFYKMSLGEPIPTTFTDLYFDILVKVFQN